MKYLSVCSGIEAATVAWHSLGWKPVGFSEIEPFPSAVLAHHYPHVPNFGDMTKFQEWPLDAGAIDLLVGGTPCQSFSVAGLRQGLKDPRGNLMLTYLAIAARLRPRWIVWENVPGVLSSSGGRDFASFLGGLGQLGYGWAYRVLDAQWVRSNRHSHAVPQRRRRVFVVGCLGNATAAAKVLFERESVQRHSKKSEAAREEIAADAEGSVGTGCWWDGGNTSDTLTKCGANGAQRMPDKDNFGAVLQPLNEQVKWPADVAPTLNQCRTGSGSPGYSNQELLSQGGGGLIPVMSMDEECNPGIEMIGPITRGGSGGRHDCVAVQGSMIGRQDHNGPSGTGCSSNGEMFTLTTTDVHAVAQAIPLDLRNSQRDPEKHDAQNRQGLGVGSVGDPAPTVDASFVHGVAQVNMQGSKSNACVSTDGSSFTLNAMHGHDVHAVAQAMTVRRLTPRECERLQGFPDDYTLIPWRKKAAGDCPDGPRYKALGNSMAVNCMEWIGERIAAVEAGEDA